MTTSASLSARPSLLMTQFQIQKDEDIVHFFPEHKRNLREIILSKIQGIVHFFQTGVWIDQDKLLQFAGSHPEAKVSELFKGHALQRKLIRHEHSMVVPKSSFFTAFFDGLKFILQFLKNPSEVGAILPSSAALAREICSEIPKNLTAKRRLILEAGPGTGNFSDKIIQRMNPQDELHLVEYDKAFYDHLVEKYKHIPNVHVFHRSILDHVSPSGEKYDIVVSGLPMNGFPAPMVKAAFQKFRDITHERSTLSYFEYPWVPYFTKLFAKKADVANLETILEEKRRFYEAHPLRTATVYSNVPPARVVHHSL